MDLFRSITGTSPGANLSGRDKIAFDELKTVIDRCTHDLLIRPDWVANMELIDLANSEKSKAVMAEVVVVLKNKICSKDVKVVLMTLCLVEAMVKNGTPLVHASIGTDFFMKEMANTARKYNAKIGQDNREVVDQCLNMIQCWGEGFAASGSQNYFSKYYQDLRREGLPFNQNFDRSQLTDFSPPAGSTNAGPSAAQEMEDEILAAALAASLNSENVQSRPQSERTGAYGSSAAAPYRDYPAQSAHVVGNVVSVSSSGSSSGASFVELVSSATSSCALLRDMINASSSVAELRSNDIAEEVAGQIRGYQSQIMSSVELALTSYPEAVEGLFQSAEECGTVLSLYDEKRKGGAAYMPAGVLPKSRHGVEPSIAHPPVHTPPASSTSASSAPAPLLDFSDQGDDEIGNPMLMMQQNHNSSARKAEPVASPVQARALQPPPTAMPVSPPAAQFAASSSPPAKVASPSTSSSTFPSSSSGHGAVVDDPFGNTSSIDALLTPASAPSAAAGNSKTGSDDLLDFLSGK